MARLTLYTKVNCHLCDVVKEKLERVRVEEPFELDIVDINSDPALFEQYKMEIPVVLVDGQKWAKYRIDEAALLRRLRSPA